MISWKKIEKEDYTVIHFELEKPLEPADLKTVSPPSYPVGKGVVLSGRGPVWLYGYLVHMYHPARFVAIYDPRIGAVVVESHCKDVDVGDVLQVVVE